MKGDKTAIPVRPSLRLIITATVIFLIEGLIMLMLHRASAWADAVPPWIKGVLDALVLSAMVFPFLYVLWFRPLRAEMVKRQRVERFKDEVLDVFSHELHTPLAIVQEGVSQLGEGLHGPLSNSQRDCLQEVSRGAARLNRLVERSLLVTKILADKVQYTFTALDVGRVILDVERRYHFQAAAKGVVLRVSTTETSVQCVGSAVYLAEAMGHLVENAIEATSQGGVVTLAWTRTAAGIELTVVDTGRGIPAEQLQILFDRFSWVRSVNERKTGGLGLGLFIVRAIVEAHGGTVTAESTVGRGSTFTVRLPKRNRFEPGYF